MAHKDAHDKHEKGGAHEPHPAPTPENKRVKKTKVIMGGTLPSAAAVALLVLILLGIGITRTCGGDDEVATDRVGSIRDNTPAQPPVAAQPSEDPNDPSSCRTPCELILEGEFALVHLHPEVELHAKIHYRDDDHSPTKTGTVVFTESGAFKSAADEKLWSKGRGGSVFFETPGKPGQLVKRKRKG